MSHTPGPWTSSQHGDYIDYDGRSIVILGDDDTIRVAAAIGDDDVETNANARLIASAPDLLEAAKQARIALYSCIDALGSDEQSDFDALDALDAAIAKATGELS